MIVGIVVLAGGRPAAALLVPRQADAGALRQRRPGGDVRDRHRPRDHLHLDPGRRRSPASPGALIAAITNVKPELGFELLLPIFAVVVLGGIGNAFGALSAGLILGLVIEWSTLLIDSRWKLAIGFVVLILALVVRPQGIFGRARSV